MANGQPRPAFYVAVFAVVLGLAGEVGLGDDADHAAAVVDDGDAAHLLAAHELEHVVDVVVLADRLRVAAHDVAHARLVAGAAFGHDADGDVAIGDHPDQALVAALGLDDGQHADVLALHELRRLPHGDVGRDGARVLRHDLASLHGRSPLE